MRLGSPRQPGAVPGIRGGRAAGGRMALKHDWLDDGSLLILMPHSLLAAWSGTDASDYDRACGAADGWLVPFEVGGRRAFLLGGDPGMALLVPLPDSGLGLIRWHCADDEDELI